MNARFLPAAINQPRASNYHIVS